MAKKRMFSPAIIDSDAFLEMPLSSQCLYFHLSMRADDDGFVGNPKRISKMIGCSDDDLKILLAKRFILAFDSGVIVIKHWRINNYIRGDRYTKTTYVEELSQLKLDDKNGYTEKFKSENCCGIPNVNQMTYQMDTQIRIDKNRLDKNIKKESLIEKEETLPFEIPSLEDVKNFCLLRKNNVNPERFYSYFTARNWEIDNRPIANWQAVLISWESLESKINNSNNNSKISEHNYSAEELDALIFNLDEVEK